MSKIQINSILKTSNEVIKKEFMGIIIDNKIIYDEDKIKVTILLNKDQLKMKRETSDYCISFAFSNNCTSKCVYNVKKPNMVIYLNVETKCLIIDDNRIIIEYDLYQEKELIESVMFELMYEVIR
ncbi:MAG TPA: DUF1934 family protein [Mollicutes bacterium]|jgi:hypothetical protein|nr:DUF1934 family protein [Mollicutes bacterium]